MRLVKSNNIKLFYPIHKQMLVQLNMIAAAQAAIKTFCKHYTVEAQHTNRRWEEYGPFNCHILVAALKVAVVMSNNVSGYLLDVAIDEIQESKFTFSKVWIFLMHNNRESD